MQEYIKQVIYYIDIKIDLVVKYLQHLNLGGDPWPIHLEPKNVGIPNGKKIQYQVIIKVFL